MKNLYLCCMLLAAMLLSYNANSQLRLSSLTSATATLFLDFDGHNVNSPIWNGGNSFTCAAAPLSAIQITEIFNRVAEDYRPFNINITTDSSIFLAAPLAKRIRVIITPTSAWFAGVGGVAFTGSFTWGDDTPCFVFCDRLGNSPKYVAECCSHESGHTLGLSHQSKYDGGCNLTATYNEGAGTGEAAWAPIMGNSYYRNMSGWNNGPTPYGCNNTQDNLTIISTQNGFGYRADDFSDDINTNPTEINLSSISFYGLISTNTDKDAFSFLLNQNSNFKLDVTPYSVASNNEGADLDLRVSLYNASRQLIKVYDPSSILSVSIDTILLAGRYYIVVDGTGNSNASDYGSLGSYSIRGLPGTLPVKSIILTGKTQQNQHQLNWQIISDEPVKSIHIQSSSDGNHFVDLTSPNSMATSFNYTAQQTSNLFYRIKLVSFNNQILYSNSILLKAANKPIQSFIVSTFVQDKATINAGKQYQYLLSDAKGNVVLKGNGNKGFNSINTSRLTSGMYILQLSDGTTNQTERIVKQY